MNSRAHILALVLACLSLWAGRPAAAADTDTVLEQVLVSRQANTASVELQFECRYRYVDHFPLTQSDRLRIKLASADPCARLPVSTPRRETRRPVGRELADLREVELIRDPDGSGLVLLHFTQPVTVTVKQRGDLRRLVVSVELPAVDPGEREDRLPSTAPDLMQPVMPAVAPDPGRIARANARAEQATNATFSAPGVRPKMYAINLESSLQPVDSGSLSPEMFAPGLQLYGTEVVINGRTWHRLRLGFFETEAEAKSALESLQSGYPRGWVVRVPDKEHAVADANAIEPIVAGRSLAAVPAKTSAGVAVPAAAATGGLAKGLSAEQIDALMHEAQASMRSGDHDRAIQIYTKVLREPEHAASRRAQELIGLARERKGQTAQAVMEYRRYLMLYPDDEGAARVRQRLAGLTAVRAASTDKLVVTRKKRSAPASRWDIYGGLAQYYRRDASQFDGGDQVVSQSSLLTDFDLITRRSGDRLDFSSRVTLGNLYDMLGGKGPGNSTRIYYLYADLVDNRWDWSARIGRQSLRGGGVLGRFDGANVSWQWRPDVRFNVMSGFPVDSSIDSIDTDRVFYGVSTDLTDVFDTVDVSVFYNTQFVNGIDDRQAVGGEVRYFDSARSLIALIDYDISYGEMNSFVVLGNWAFPNRVTLNAMADFRKSPLLTTRNALIGQGATTLDNLVVLFGEKEVRQLARDRTGDLRTYSAGVSLPLFDRFQLNTDISVVDYSGTVESGGVSAIPDSGGSVYYSMMLIGSGLLQAGDRSLVGIGYSDGNGATTTTLSLDTRYPVGRGFRINPRVRLSFRQVDGTNSERWLATPSLRTFYRFARHYEFELEVGGEWSSQKTNGTTSDYNAYFIYAGYRADF